MKKKNLTKAALFTATSLFTLTSFSQEGDKNVKQKITDENGNVSMIQFSERSSYKLSDAKEIFKNQFNLKEGSEFQKIKSETDDLGFTNEKFQLFHQGIKVEFATYSLHSKGGSLKSMNGEMYSLEKVNTTPTLSNQQAFQNALRHTGATSYMWQNSAEAKIMNYEKPTGELVLLPINDAVIQRGESNLRLAYKFDMYATAPVSRGDLYIDAVTGDVLFYNATIKHLGKYSNGHHSETAKTGISLEKPSNFFVAANAATKYSGTQSIETTLSGSSYILSDATRGNGVLTVNMKKVLITQPQLILQTLITIGLLPNLLMLLKTMEHSMHIGAQKKPMIIGKQHTTEIVLTTQTLKLKVTFTIVMPTIMRIGTEV